MKQVWLIGALATAILMAGCSRESRSPDAIRHDTAKATAGAVRDGRAVVEGMWDGLRTKGPVNINKASKERLESLPGISPETADAIIAGRPYSSGGELLHRHIVTKAEYNRIADRIEAR